MADLGFFNAEQVPEQTDYSPLPAGEYVVMIEKSEEKETKDLSGKYLKLTLQVVEGQYKGRRLFDNLNHVNKNAQTVDIAMRRLAAICRAVGKLQVKDSEELHDYPIIAKVAVKSDPSFGESNIIKSYGPYTIAAKHAPKAIPGASKPVGTAAKAAPWGK